MRNIVGHPIVILALIGAILCLGWQQYVAAARTLSTSKTNLLPNGNFEKFDTSGLPSGWTLQNSGSFATSTSSLPGYVAGKTLKLGIRDYKDGDALLMSPKIALQSRTNYLYKGYYLATTGFDFLVKYYYKNGTSELRLVRSYPYFDDPWSTVSTAFNTNDNIAAVQVGYRVTGNGWLQLSGLYLEPDDEVYIPRQASNLPNLLSNGDLGRITNQSPDGWSTYASGNNHAVFSYLTDGIRPYLHLDMSNAVDGEAKWQYEPLSVTPGQRFAISFDYRSSSLNELVAEYTTQNGPERFDLIDNLTPSASWTHYSTTLEVPAGATSMLVTPVAHKNGSLDTDNYVLNDLTLLGVLKYKRPLISITFDDGWQSAYASGAKLCDDVGFRGTFYVNPGSIDNDKSFMKKPELQDLKKRGHQIASHGYDHIDMTSINHDELTRQLAAARGYFEKNLGLQNIDFATPYGKDDQEVQAVIRQHYRSHRGTETGVNTRQNMDPYNLKVIFVRTDTPLSTIQSEIDEAKANNGWLIFTYHRVENGDNRSEMITSPSVFKQHLELIKESGVEVKTVGAALDELQAQ